LILPPPEEPAAEPRLAAAEPAPEDRSWPASDELMLEPLVPTELAGT
jgi:hypothetical protein